MSSIEVSVVCPVGRHVSEITLVHREIRDVLRETGRSAEFLYVLDGPRGGTEEALRSIREEHFPVRILRMAKGFGEATALQVGFEQAQGRYIVTVADRPQIDAATLRDILAELDGGAEVVVTRRDPRSDHPFNRLQSRIFHGLLRWLVGQSFHDMTCGLRGMTADAAHKLDLYGDQHRFIPVIATRCGYSVVELPGAQHPANRRLRLYHPGIYVRRLLDLLNVYFLSRFTRKPLRFFGLVGLGIGGAGFVICAYLAGLRLFAGSPLAGRPLLLLGVLLVVLGFQLTSLGLLGEIVIFLSSRRESPDVTEFDTARPEVERSSVSGSS